MFCVNPKITQTQTNPNQNPNPITQTLPKRLRKNKKKTDFRFYFPANGFEFDIIWNNFWSATIWADFKFHTLSSKILKIPEFNLEIPRTADGTRVRFGEIKVLTFLTVITANYLFLSQIQVGYEIIILECRIWSWKF